MNRYRLILGLIAVSISHVACASRQHHDVALDLAMTTGALAVDVENFRGPVEIRSDARHETIQVRGVVRVDGDKSRRAGMLAAVNIRAELDEINGRGVLKVRSTSTRAQYDDHDAVLAILVPRCDGVRVVNEGGDVIVVNASGAAEITNRNGAIEYRTAQAVTDPMTLMAVDGSIFLQVPEGSTGLIDLETLEGRVRYRDKVGSDFETSSIREKAFSGRLEGGENPIVARTNRGDVNVWVHEDPVALVRTFRRWSPPLADRMHLQSSRRYTRNLPDDHPEVTGPSSRAETRGPSLDYE